MTPSLSNLKKYGVFINLFIRCIATGFKWISLEYKSSSLSFSPKK